MATSAVHESLVVSSNLTSTMDKNRFSRKVGITSCQEPEKCLWIPRSWNRVLVARLAVKSGPFQGGRVLWGLDWAGDCYTFYLHLAKRTKTLTLFRIARTPSCVPKAHGIRFSFGRTPSDPFCCCSLSLRPEIHIK